MNCGGYILQLGCHVCPQTLLLHSQGAEEIDDHGAELVAKAVHLLRGPAAASVTAGDCKLLTVDMLADLSTVRDCRRLWQTMVFISPKQGCGEAWRQHGGHGMRWPALIGSLTDRLTFGAILSAPPLAEQVCSTPASTTQ